MRVLQVVPSLDPKHGGPSRAIPLLCRALAEAGVEVELWTFRAPGQSETIGERVPWGAIRRFAPWPGTAEFPRTDFARELRHAVTGFDLVHLHALWNPKITVAAAACRRARVPYLISPHGMLQEVSVSVKGPLKRVYYRLFEKATLEGAAAVHFLTGHEAEESTRWTPAAMLQLIAPNGIDPGLGKGIQPGTFRNAHPQLHGRRLLLFLGRLHWSKGLDLQLETVARLARQMPDVTWVLVGPDGGQWSGLWRKVREHGLAAQVLWTGPLPWRQCLEALADADLFLLTSRHEAHSVAMNEALAMGVPVLLSDTVRFHAVEEWGAGRVAADADQLAQAAVEILSDGDLAAAMGRAGRKMASDLLAWPKVADAMLRGYRTLLGQGAGVPACEETAHA
ncbi:MAG TPA: glycosyltransferase [Terriglobales bacterium]|nr:glycosyltransferase [Terriglobales bacterium]